MTKKNITLAELYWNDSYRGNTSGPYDNGELFAPGNNVPSVVKKSEDLVVSQLLAFLSEGGSSHGPSRYIDHSKANQGLSIFYREPDKRSYDRWGTSHAIALHMSVKYDFMKKATDAVINAYKNDQAFFEHLMPRMAKTVSSLEELSHGGTYRNNSGVIRRAVLTYSKSLADVIDETVNPIIEVDTNLYANPPYMDIIKSQGGDSRGIADRALARLVPDIFEAMAPHILYKLVVSDTLSNTFARIAPTWIKENSDDAPDDQVIAAWSRSHHEDDEVIYFDISPKDALSELDELPDHLRVQYKDMVSQPLQSDIDFVRKELIDDYTIHRDPSNISTTLGTVIAEQLESLEESGVLTMDTNWFMEQLGVNEKIFEHVTDGEWGFRAESFKPVDGIENEAFELVLRRIRVQQVTTDQFIQECLEKAIQLNQENLTEYYGEELTDALDYYGFSPEDIREIRWT